MDPYSENDMYDTLPSKPLLALAKINWAIAFLQHLSPCRGTGILYCVSTGQPVGILETHETEKCPLAKDVDLHYADLLDSIHKLFQSISKAIFR